MKDEDKAEIKKVVREVVNEIVANQRIMPVPDPTYQVTEIIVRCGPPSAVQMLGGAPVSLCVPCVPRYVPSLSDLDEDSKKLLQQIQKVTGDKPEVLLEKLDREIAIRRLSEEIKGFARKLGVLKE